MKRFGFFVLFLTGLLGTDLAFAAESPVGKWKTVDEQSGKVTSEVEIYEQSGKLFGKVVALAEPDDKQGKPKICSACTGADKNKTIVGLVILKDLTPSGDRYKNGTVLDPQDGKVYPAEIWVEDGKLMVRGYSGFLYKTRSWLKA
jgi:uncharacterized protein (DUF2147 family)